MQTSITQVKELKLIVLLELIKNIFLHSNIPSIELQELLKLDDVKNTFAELLALKEIQGCPKYHPEGSVFEHTMQTLDASTEIDGKSVALKPAPRV